MSKFTGEVGSLAWELCGGSPITRGCDVVRWGGGGGGWGVGWFGIDFEIIGRRSCVGFCTLTSDTRVSML